MKFTVSKHAVLEALQVVGSVVAPRGVQPILNNVHLVVEADGIARLSATDLEISIRYRLPLSQCEGSGQALLPSGRTLSIIRESNADQITFTCEEKGKISIKAGHGVFDIVSGDPAEFPPIPEFKATNAIGIERDKFLRLIRKTQFAVAKEKSRFGFNGAMFHITNGEARMVATDGKRLVMAWDTIGSAESAPTRPIIPLRALSAFDKLMSLDADAVQVSFDEREIMLKTARAEASSRLVEGAFPDYQAVIPKESTIKVRFARQELSSAFRQAAILTSQESRSVRIFLENGKATLKAQAPDAGAATIDLDAPDFTVEPVSIAFNPDYFDEGLKVMEAETVTLSLSRSNLPATLTGDPDFLYVVMPITLRNG